MLGFVDDVVVDQGGRVQHLDHGTHADARSRHQSRESAKKEAEQRPDPLAATRQEVTGELR